MSAPFNRSQQMQVRVSRMAELVSGGASPTEAGALMGLTKGQTASVWRAIKADLGPQAA